MHNEQNYAEVIDLLNFRESKLSTTRPETDPQLLLKPSDGEGVGDGGAVDDSSDDRVVHVDFTREGTDRSVSSHGRDERHVPEIERESSQTLENRIGYRRTRPVGVQVPWSGPLRTANGRSGHVADPTQRSRKDRQRREDEEKIQRAIYGWTPRDIEPEVWDMIRPLTQEMTAIMHEEKGWQLSGVSGARRRIALFLVHCYVNFGRQPSTDLFRPDLIEHYVASLGMSEASQNLYWITLSSLSKHLHSEDWIRVYPTPQKTGTPYTSEEIQGFLEWAASQSTAKRRYWCHMAIALALGAGLRSAEIPKVEARDVTERVDGVFINVGRIRDEDDYWVPVEEEFAGFVAEAASGRAPDELVGVGYKVLVNAYLRGGRSLPRRHPNIYRLRNVWILKRLKEGRSEAEVCRMAGRRQVLQFQYWAATYED